MIVIMLFKIVMENLKKKLLVLNIF